ncbi:MAG: hypothetical protein CSB47_10440 [Proteobacteria bacterium]|nr:MAG: hypothetical protein CSB47_10440 [Pseudomonadota bacterium]
MSTKGNRRKLNDVEMSWAKNLKKAQKEAKKKDPKLTQEYIAAAVGISQPTLSHYMGGRNALNRGVLFELCAVIGVNPFDIAPELIPSELFGSKTNLDKLLSTFVRLDPDMQESYLKLMVSSLKD